jgi:Thiamine pyrophosphate enzyme, N-terminal TPP binding domain
MNGIMEALRKRQNDIRFIQVRHEEAAALMACGYAKYTGRLGACLVLREGSAGISIPTWKKRASPCAGVSSLIPTESSKQWKFMTTALAGAPKRFCASSKPPFLSAGTKEKSARPIGGRGKRRCGRICNSSAESSTQSQKGVKE